MPARAYWTGQIRLALVSIPVQLFSATKSAAKVSFNQIHKPTGKRIRYEKVVPGVGKAEADDIVRGYEVEKGKYVLFEDEEIEDVKLEAKRTIDLVQFVDEDQIDPVYFDKPIYVSPDDDEVAGEAYVVLRDAMKETGKVGLGQIVIRGKASIVCLKPHGKGLVIETLRYPEEVHKADQFFADVPEVEPEEELKTMAEELIKRKVKPFDPKAFKDPYDAALREMIEAKLEDRPPEAIDEPEVGAQVINLMDALKKSMSAESGKGGASKSSSRKTAAKSSSSQSKSSAKSAKGKAAAKSDDKGGEKKTGSRSRRAA